MGAGAPTSSRSGHVLPRFEGARLPYLDGWRGLAIAAVLIGHFGAGSGMSRLGVELFFVLSGRLMADLLFYQRVSLGYFLYRRFTRVWPTLLAVVLATWVGSRWLPITEVHVPVVLACLTYLYNYFALFVHPQGSLGHIWSLCVEEHSYLLLALVSLLTAKLWKRDSPLVPLVIMAVLAAVSIGIGVLSLLAFDQPYQDVYWRSDVRLASVLIGGCAYLAWRRDLLGRVAGLPVAEN